MAKIVKEETICEVCGQSFQGEFLLHENITDDFDWEKEMVKDAKSMGRLEFYEKWQDNIENWQNPIYPHTHTQPTPECHICPSCREKFKSGVKV